MIAGCLVLSGVVGVMVHLIHSHRITDEAQKAELQQRMKNYLDTTYATEFTVGKPYLTGNEGFGYNTWIAEVHPTYEPGLVFHIAWETNQSKPFQDSYLVTWRTAQGKPAISKYLKEVYGNDINFIYNLSETEKELERLDHDELIKKHGDTVFFYLHYYVFIDYLDKNAEAEKVYKVYKVYKNYILDNQIKHFSIVVVYYSKGYESEFARGFQKTNKVFLPI